MTDAAEGNAPPAAPPGRLASGLRSTPVGMAVIVVLLVVIFGILSNGAFVRVSNLSAITLNVAVTMLLAVGITFVLAVASYYLIEMPVVRWRGRVAARTKGALGRSAAA